MITNYPLFLSQKISYKLFLPHHFFSVVTQANTRLYNKSLKSTQVMEQFLTAYKNQQVQVLPVIYQAVFLGFAALFLILGLVVASKTTNWACSVYFEDCRRVKMITSLFCLGLSGSSLVISYLIRPAIDLFSLSRHAAFLLLAYIIPTPTINPIKVRMKVMKCRPETKALVFFKRALEQMNRDLKNILI